MAELNWMPVAASAVMAMMLGALWYSPIAFGNAWMAALGKTADDLGSAAPAMAGSMVVCVVSAIAVETLVQMSGAYGLLAGLKLGTLLGLGLVATAMLSDALFCGHPWRLYLIQAGYRAVYLIGMALICAMWPR